MVLTHTKARNRGQVLGFALIALLFVVPSFSSAHKSELSSWLTMQRDASGWVGLIEVRIPAKLLELGVGIADVSRDGSLSEKEFAALARDYARRAVAALSIEVDGAPVVVKVEKVSWKAQGARTLDVVASLSIAPLARPSVSAETLTLRLRRGGGRVILAVQTQDAWQIKSSSPALIGPDRKGFLEPWTMIPDQPVRVDLLEDQAVR